MPFHRVVLPLTNPGSINGAIPAPESSVTALEDKIIQRHEPTLKNLTAQLGKLKVKDATGNVDAMPERPSFGSAGKDVVVWANYFPITFKTPILYRYVLEVVEVVKSKSESGREPVTREVPGRKLHLAIQRVLDELYAADKSQHLASQFKNQIISLKEINLPENPLHIELPRGGADDSVDTILVTLRGPTEIRVADMLKYTQTLDDSGNRTKYPKYPEIIDVLDTILGHTARSRLNEVSALGSSRLFPFDKDEKSTNLMQDRRALLAARGYFQSARLGTGRLLLNTQVTHGVFKVSGKVDEIMKTLQMRSVPRTEHRLKKLVGAFAKFLPKTRVWATFTVGNGTSVKRPKAIHGLVTRFNSGGEGENRPKLDPAYDYPGPKNIQFWLQGDAKAGRYITVHEYYKQSMWLVKLLVEAHKYTDNLQNIK